MISETCRVTFQPEGKSVLVPKDSTLYEAANEAGIVLNAVCGGAGTCGKCIVRVTSGSYHQKGSEKYLPAGEVEQGTVLACRTRVTGDSVVEIPVSSRLFEQKVLTGTGGRQRRLRLEPNVRKVSINVTPPTLDDPRSDFDRVLEALDNYDLTASPDALRLLPEAMRNSGYKLTVVMDQEELIAFEPGDTTDVSLGVAFDIGTTTVVGYLLDLNTGTELAVGSRTNPQTSFGDDVVSRIQYAGSTDQGLLKLHSLITGCMNDIISELAEKAGIDRSNIYEVTATGNTTMLHLLLQLSPKYLALNPYVGVFRSSVQQRCSRFDIEINPLGKLHTLPSIGGFVGGDTVAVILASGMYRSRNIKFAVDIGTNGELVMGSLDRLVSCSTAAGPAFEGARIAFGMRASGGAVERVEITDREVEVMTIGNEPAAGLCGTGLIDAIAELLDAGLITTSGKLLKPGDLSDSTPGFLRERVIEHPQHGASFILAHAENSRTGGDILLTQKDIRETQLGKGAIFAGYRILLQALGIDDSDVAEVLLAGAFGNYIRKENAVKVGLIPDLPLNRIKFIGNAAGAGARMVLLSREMRGQADQISASTEYIELATNMEFQKIFADSMFFPKV
jgi:uncharacterized 2Fe-2S/4Fe-4S cluster protein (DUF4445 family)